MSEPHAVASRELRARTVAGRRTAHEIEQYRWDIVPKPDVLACFDLA